ncbi:branched-chain amino acid transport system II carrier protein [Oscillibacter valericigenes]|uniref:branched-chain amino acid transport system II carrier protein n=1 Tax=Oscillibacter valericigenes TaxID=351091 RepID=UPI001F3B506D|nr:branched-chain amino acid transport system II carrier protein [Oscillibacter valericigenes]MCF2664497.1 branched-chain amino acid transport system II carrier protein [Oscillibacter valericigenes]
MKRSLRDMFVIGFALFSMFFGAGNVIFPPYLGLSCGKQWFLGFVCYYLADIGLALAALFAVLRSGSPEHMTRRIGKVPSTLLMSAIILCIGPMLAIPRTAATTYEMSLAPLVSGFSPVLFSLLFFAVILLLCLRESAVVDIVGKVLTPVLLIGLLVLIVKGVADPIGPVPDRVPVDNVPVTGIEAGYQTMDVLAAAVFGIIILKSARDKGYTDPKDQARVVAGAGLVAGAALLVVYLGLTYLGVTTSRFFDLSVLRTFLVVSIVRNLMGNAGIVLFSIVVALACVTTAVALVSSAASYFSKLSGGRLRYTWLVIAICLFSAAAANLGLDQIVSIAAPILSIVYPPTLVLICLSFFDRRIQSDWVFRMAALGALVFSLLETAASFGLDMPFLARMPLASLGFGWVVPAAACGVLGALIGRSRPAKT